VVLNWYENGHSVPTPEGWEGDFKSEEGGMVMYGSKNKLYHEGMRPTSPRIFPNARRNEMMSEMQKIPRCKDFKGGPIEQWIKVIKGEEKATSSHFDYAAPLTEMVLLGVLAQRIGQSIEYDAEHMKVTNIPGLEHYIKEPVREGWSYGENLWT
jgi:hypothetical protein